MTIATLILTAVNLALLLLFALLFIHWVKTLGGKLKAQAISIVSSGVLQLIQQATQKQQATATPNPAANGQEPHAAHATTPERAA